tara:strand:- start:3111 stop:3350 length:240 start_codon:yes stop_codon:yes gene_type:complete
MKNTSILFTPMRNVYFQNKDGEVDIIKPNTRILIIKYKSVPSEFVNVLFVTCVFEKKLLEFSIPIRTDETFKDYFFDLS